VQKVGRRNNLSFNVVRMVDTFVYDYRIAQPEDINPFFRIRAYPYARVLAELGQRPRERGQTRGGAYERNVLFK